MAREFPACSGHIDWVALTILQRECWAIGHEIGVMAAAPRWN
jgi:hypothetical protein